MVLGGWVFCYERGTHVRVWNTRDAQPVAAFFKRSSGRAHYRDTLLIRNSVWNTRDALPVAAFTARAASYSYRRKYNPSVWRVSFFLETSVSRARFLSEGPAGCTWKREFKLQYRKAGLLKSSRRLREFGPVGCQ